MNPQNVWLVLAFGADRQYGGNAGYEDQPTAYTYDSFVANHKQVHQGDWMIVCDRDRALGFANIETIAAAQDMKRQLRCPTCKTTGLKARKTASPKYRCFNGHVFEEPDSSEVECTKYTAYFRAPVLTFDENVPRILLRKGVLKPSDQVTMQRFVLQLVEAELVAAAPKSFGLISTCVSGAGPSSDSADQNGTGTGPGEVVPDMHARALRQILARRGQAAFRQALRQRYSDRCLISGCRLMDVVEAAHIALYAGQDDNNPENGILLRSDLHTLFDLNLIGIDPNSLEVHVHPLAGEYAQYQGRRLLLCSGKQPARDALNVRWAAFKSLLPGVIDS